VWGYPAAVISASHNPFPDNGIKFFAAGGRKLDDAAEDGIETELERLLAMTAGSGGARPQGVGVGVVRPNTTARAAYVEHLVDVLGRRLDGLRSSSTAATGGLHHRPRGPRRLGVKVEVRNADPTARTSTPDAGRPTPQSSRRRS